MRVLCIIVLLCSCLAQELFVSNLNDTCLQCLCSVYDCDRNRGCDEGYCGPFFISRVYWADAGKPTLAEDDPIRTGAFQDCVQDYGCAVRTIQKYMAIHGKDCNGDGVTDCFDYMMINYNGGNDCRSPLFKSPHGRQLLTKFSKCKL